MLSVSRVGVRQGRSYYTQDNYYTQDRAIENSEWQGLGASLLGLSGQVAPKDFERLLRGISPKTGEQLNSRHDNEAANRRAGIDLTLSAPKSVSLVALIDQNTQLERAHQTAVERTLQFVEERYSLARTGSKENRQISATGNLIVAKFHHDTSRERDPQLHTHCVVLNAVKRDDGQWRSLHNDGMFSNSKLIGLIYQNELAREVQKLGYAIERKQNGTFEISGYSEEQLRAFSKRTQKIEALDCETKKQERKEKLKNRPTKGDGVSRETLLGQWQRESNSIGIIHPHPEQRLANRLPQEIPSQMADSALRHASEKDVQFRREVVEKFALESNLGKIDWRAFQLELALAECKGKLICIEKNRFTTENAINTEQRILRILSQGKDRFTPIGTDVYERLEKSPLKLSTGQTDAVKITMQSRDQFLAWQGVAGAGKTFAMNVVRELASEKEIQLRGFAPSAEAAKVLEQESHIPSQTVAGLLATSPLRAGHKKNEVWIVDEAGLLSARDCDRLMQRAQLVESRIIFVGDTRQLSAVEAGNPFRLLQQNGIPTAQLTESRRQKNEILKTSVDLMAQGKQREALQAISAQIVELKREATRAKYITKEYMALAIPDRDKTLILAGTNAERDLLTSAIRQALKKENSLGAGITVTTLQARDLSREELTDVANLDVGNVVVFHKESKRLGIAKSEACEVVSVDTRLGLAILKTEAGKDVSFQPKQHRNSFLVCEKSEVEVCVGERLRWTRNDKDLGVRNGQECILEGNDQGILSLKHSNKKRLDVSSKQLLHLDHNYVNTVFSSQGKTCDQSIISVDQTFGREAMYVALSRARNNAKIVTPDKEEMMNIVAQSKAKISALELFPEQKTSQDLGEGQRQTVQRRMTR